MRERWRRGRLRESIAGVCGSRSQEVAGVDCKRVRDHGEIEIAIGAADTETILVIRV